MISAAECREIERAVDGEVRSLLRRGCPGDMDDLRQQAWEIALEAVGSATRDRSRSLEAYVRGVLWIQLRHYASLQTATVTVHGRSVTRAADYSSREDAYDERADAHSDADEEVDRVGHVRRAIEDVLAGMSDAARPLARLMFTGEQMSPAEAAEAIGVAATQAYEAARRFREGARRHPILRELAGAPEIRRAPRLRVVQPELVQAPAVEAQPVAEPVADAQQQLSIHGLEPVPTVAAVRTRTRCARRPPAAQGRRRVVRRPVCERQTAFLWTVRSAVQQAFGWSAERRSSATPAGRGRYVVDVVGPRAGPVAL